MARLGDYVRIRTGKLDANASSENGQYPFFTCAVEPLKIDTYSYDCECVLVAGNGDLNVKYYNGKFDAYQRTYIIESLDKDVLSVPYLYWFLGKYVETLRQQAIGGVIKYIKLGNLTEAEILIPSIAEQENIVANISKANELISLRKEQLAKLDLLVKARFVELFIGKGYPTKTVDEVSLGKGEYGAQSASVEYDPARPRYVRITDINDDGTLNDDVVASINPADDEQYKLEYGDFMFARMGATVGKTYAFVEGNQIFAGYLIRYRLNREFIDPRYLYWYTRLDEYLNWVKLNQSGAAQPGINAKKYGSLQIPLSPIDKQNVFAAFVEQTDKSKLAIQQSLDKLETLKKSLMQEYFGQKQHQI